MKKIRIIESLGIAILLNLLDIASKVAYIKTSCIMDRIISRHIYYAMKIQDYPDPKHHWYFGYGHDKGQEKEFLEIMEKHGYRIPWQIFNKG